MELSLFLSSHQHRDKTRSTVFIILPNRSHPNKLKANKIGKHCRSNKEQAKRIETAPKDLIEKRFFRNRLGQGFGVGKIVAQSFEKNAFVVFWLFHQQVLS